MRQTMIQLSMLNRRGGVVRAIAPSLPPRFGGEGARRADEGGVAGSEALNDCADNPLIRPAGHLLPLARGRRDFAGIPRFLSIICLLLVATTGRPAIAQQGQQVRIVEVVWGFDGRVVPGQFMPLSILVDNLSDEPIEAQARLASASGMLREVGGTAIQPVFLGPNSRRWVQFYPYVVGRMTAWRFTLQTAEKTHTFDDIDQPRAVFDNSGSSDQNAPQSLPAVILDPTGVLSKQPTSIKHMPAEIFPPYATATHGLYAMFLDHVPDWEAPRQESLLSWLKSGGRLHLLLDQNNQTLRFSGTLAALNEPFPEFTVGTGTVTRHDFQRGQLTVQTVAPVVTPPQVAPEDEEDAKAFNLNQSNRGYWRTGQIDDGEMFSELRELTQPDHAWWLIFLLSLCYVGLIFPGCWILSKQRTLHFLVTYGAIAGLAAVFSLFFLLIGRRGYGEATSVHTLAIARAEDETHWSLFEYSTLFVTDGDNYTIDSKDQQALLASGASEESVEADITSGNTASFVSRIPPFSNQSLLSRRRLTADDWKLAITGFSQSGSQLTNLTLACGDKFPSGKDVQCFVLHGRDVHGATIDATKNELTLANSRQRFQDFCQPENQDGSGRFATPFGFVPNRDPEPDPLLKCFKDALPRLAQRSLVDDCVENISRFRLPEGRVRLMVYAPIPVSMQLSVRAEARRDGRILYIRDLPLSSDASVAGEAVPNP